MKLEIYDGMPNEEYHRLRDWGWVVIFVRLSHSKPLAHYKHESANPKESDAFLIQSALHSLTLEDDRDSIELVDPATWTGKAERRPRTQLSRTARTHCSPRTCQ